jgi:ribosomal protein L1
MDADALNMSIRKFLKHVGVHSQREIEAAVERGIATGTLKGNESLAVRMTLTLDGTGVEKTFEDRITLE